MNDLGLRLAWAAVQVALLLVPALALGSLASRLGPAAGAWVSAVSLGLVVVLTASALLPGPWGGRGDGSVRPAVAWQPTPSVPAGAASAGADRGPTDRLRSGVPTFGGLAVVWGRIRRGVARPAAACRPWGGVVAATALAGTAVALLRLAIDLGAVAACRRRGRVVDDPTMTGLLADLGRAIGCRVEVELREVPDLVGPATAGWRRPVVLLPADWRSWDEPERRAVLAHELAHVVGGDYAAGLLARLAVALNAYHPLVRWAAGRLRLQQELAADEVAARHAGGCDAYLVALSRLALRQDGWSPSRPARAFLPAHGTLIRRIAMLRRLARTDTTRRPWSNAPRLATAVLLLCLTAAVASLRNPARGSQETGPAANAPAANAAADDARSFVAPFVGNATGGVIVVRPAAALRHPGMGRFAVTPDQILGIDLTSLARELAVDTSRPGFVTLHVQDLDWVTLGLNFGKKTGGDGRPLHSLEFGPPAFRTVAPFDWRAFLRQWRVGTTEVREVARPYYRLTGPVKEFLGQSPCVYLPDDRTAVFAEEAPIRRLAEGTPQPRRAFLQGEDWAKACRGVLAVAVDNENGAFARAYDMGRPDDPAVLSLFQGVDHWVLAAEDRGSIALHASASARDAEAGRAVSAAIGSLLTMGKDATRAAGQAEPAGVNAEAGRMVKTLLDGLSVRQSGRSVVVHAEGFGTLADVLSVVTAETALIGLEGQDGKGVGVSESPKR